MMGGLPGRKDPLEQDLALRKKCVCLGAVRFCLKMLKIKSAALSRQNAPEIVVKVARKQFSCVPDWQDLIGR